MHNNYLCDSVKTICLEKIWFSNAKCKNVNLQVDEVILGRRGQACPDMPKEAIKTLRSQKLKKV